MSLFGITKGTELEKQIQQSFEGEIRGVGFYHGLMRLAKEQGLDDVANVLLKLANDEARHAGLYAQMNGLGGSDIFAVLAKSAEVESNAFPQIQVLAEQVRLLGFGEAAKEIELAAKDEEGHAKALFELVKNK